MPPPCAAMPSGIAWISQADGVVRHRRRSYAGVRSRSAGGVDRCLQSTKSRSRTCGRRSPASLSACDEMGIRTSVERGMKASRTRLDRRRCVGTVRFISGGSLYQRDRLLRSTSVESRQAGHLAAKRRPLALRPRFAAGLPDRISSVRRQSTAHGGRLVPITTRTSCSVSAGSSLNQGKRALRRAGPRRYAPKPTRSSTDMLGLQDRRRHEFHNDSSATHGDAVTRCTHQPAGRRDRRGGRSRSIAHTAANAETGWRRALDDGDVSEAALAFDLFEQVTSERRGSLRRGHRPAARPQHENRRPQHDLRRSVLADDEALDRRRGVECAAMARAKTQRSSTRPVGARVRDRQESGSDL